MADSRPQNVVLVGNAGAGKSWLGNLLCQTEVFKSQYNLEPVTRFQCSSPTSFAVSEGGLADPLLVYDTPGLLDVDESRFKHNRQQLADAFASANPTRVLFVVGIGASGRWSDETWTTFRLVRDAFKIGKESIGLLFNQVRRDPDMYRVEVLRVMPADVIASHGTLAIVPYLSLPDAASPSGCTASSDEVAHVRRSVLQRCVLPLQSQCCRLVQPLHLALESASERALRLSAEHSRQREEAEQQTRQLEEQRRAQEEAEASARRAHAAAEAAQRKAIAARKAREQDEACCAALTVAACCFCTIA